MPCRYAKLSDLRYLDHSTTDLLCCVGTLQPASSHSMQSFLLLAPGMQHSHCLCRTLKV